MILLNNTTLHILKHPLDFALQTLRGFNKNQGLLLAGAIAYYALLSLLPFLILLVIVLSHFVAQQELFHVLRHYLEWLVPSQSHALLDDVAEFLDDRIRIGAVLFITMIFFSSLAFSVLEKAMSVIFVHHKISSKRHFMVSAILPYCFVVLLCMALLFVTGGSIALQAMGEESIRLFGREWSLHGLSGVLLYLLGLSLKIGILTTLYLILPIRQLSVRHALIGGIAAALLWEIIHYLLIWYFTSISKASVVYGSLTTSVVALLSMEIAAALFLLGAQVISEYERLEKK
jgi:membrane protein